MVASQYRLVEGVNRHHQSGHGAASRGAGMSKAQYAWGNKKLSWGQGRAGLEGRGKDSDLGSKSRSVS